MSVVWTIASTSEPRGGCPHSGLLTAHSDQINPQRLEQVELDSTEEQPRGHNFPQAMCRAGKPYRDTPPDRYLENFESKDAI